MRFGRTAALALSAAVFAAAATAARAYPPAPDDGARLWAAGSDDAAWLVHTDDQRDPLTGLPIVRLFYSGRANPDGAASYWRRLNPLVGRLQSAIADRDGLLLQFEDGGIVRVTALSSAPVPRPHDGAAIRAWCGDAGATGAFAIIQIQPNEAAASAPAGTAPSAEPRSASDGDLERDRERERSGSSSRDSSVASARSGEPPLTSAPASQPALRPGAWLFRFDGGAWHSAGLAPIPERSSGLWMIARDGKALLIWGERAAVAAPPGASRPAGETVRLRSIEWSGDEWQSPQTVAEDVPAASLWSGWSGESPLLLAGAPRGGGADGVELQLFRRAAGGWLAGEWMQAAEGRAALTAATAVGFAQNRWIFARTAEGDRIEFGFAPPTDAPSLTWARINNPATGPTARPWTSWVSTAALFVMLGLLVFLRPERVTGRSALPADFAIAPPSWRILAACLDLLPVLVATGYWWMPLLVEAQDKIQLYPVGDAEGLRVVTELATQAQLLIVGAYSAYCFVSEATMGTTPAKRLLDMRVFDEQGRPPRMRQILIRNLLRVAELGTTWVAFFSLFVMLVLSPRRQRLGDLIARTVVGAYSRTAAAQPPGDEPSRMQGGDKDERGGDGTR